MALVAYFAAQLSTLHLQLCTMQLLLCSVQLQRALYSSNCALFIPDCVFYSLTNSLCTVHLQLVYMTVQFQLCTVGHQCV